MYQLSVFVIIFAAFTDALATPSLAKPDRIVKRAACTPTSAGNSATDDTPSIAAAISSCGNGGTIVIPAGKTYAINTYLEFTGCSNCDFQIEGTLKASNNLTYWNGKSAMISVSGITNAKIRSLTGTGVIDGNGQAAWDKFASDNTLKRPTVMVITKSTGVTVDNIYFKDAPNVFHSTSGNSKNILYSNIKLYAVSSSSNVAQNTDGWDIGASSYVTVKNATVTNDDDCVAFKPGCSYVTVDTITCTGSHGLSVGSLGKTNADVVEHVYVTNANMVTSTKAVGIKTYPGGYGTATVRNVTYDGVVVSSSDYAAQIQSCYGQTADYCSSNPSTANITDVYFKNFSGTTSKKYAPTTANINCPAKGTCGIHFSNWSVKTTSGTAQVLCANINSASAGITCTSGASG
ncbi:endo-xylogalacturonan hydrolase A [Tricladium varicosporioides]|nr:endo-xylogalacturonan hydrolase A [Hymenoscyphus varicosporioides]